MLDLYMRLDQLPLNIRLYKLTFCSCTGSCPCVATGTSPPSKLIFFHDNSQLCNEIFLPRSLIVAGGRLPKQNKGAVVPVRMPRLYFRDAHENNQIMIFFSII
jgi:hypothetical protein